MRASSAWMSVTTFAAGTAELYTWLDGNQDVRFLPVDVVNTEASYEIQFGIVRRPTHYNTTWDMAKFEVCCHKWADLSEANYGVSILNDSKYGFATAGNVMRLSLIRASSSSFFSITLLRTSLQQEDASSRSCSKA